MSAPESSGWRAGADLADISPAAGIQLAGDIGRYRPTMEVREPLFARALILEADGRRLCFVTLDLCIVNNYWAAEVRRRLASRFGLPPEWVVLHCLQNHTAPALGHFFIRDTNPRFPPDLCWLRGGDDRYNEPAVAGVLKAVEGALANLQPVTLAAGRGSDGRVAFNRRFVMRDGSTRCHPPVGSPDILHVEGPTDPEVGVMAFRNEADACVALLLHHTCHPCFGAAHRITHSNWPGAWCEAMRPSCGEKGVPLVVNGCCGNIHNCNHLDPAYRPDPMGHHRAARLLADTAVQAFGRLTPLSGGRLDMRRTMVRLPLRRLKAKEIKAAEALLRRYPQPQWADAERTQVTWDWMYAATLLDLRERQAEQPWFDYEIQAFRIGDAAALVTLMGEPFVEAQLEIKRKSPAPYTWVAHFCNGYAGYLPTRRAFAGGGYETRTSNGSQFQPDALDTLTRESLALLQHLFA